jgi:hypothetical protein
MKRRLALITLAIYALALVVVTTAKTGIASLLDRSLTSSTRDAREVGYGQVRFNGAGPERWAARYRREARLVATLRREMSAKLARVVYLVGAFQCVHRYEGSWTAATGNGYYGGLQMDVGFQRTYGADLLSTKGTADHWTPAEQIGVAMTAYPTRGFYPWPNTARMCGLIP